MRWSTADARQRFSELLTQAEREPQAICNRNRPVAYVVDVATYERFAAWQSLDKGRTVSDAFDELRHICAEERYELTVPPRLDRTNPFLGPHE